MRQTASKALAVLRPEPGNAATVARASAAGFATVSLPLFEVRALPWNLPEDAFDALILTSANALRFSGAEAMALRHLPVFAVGAHTAAAAQAAGFDVMATGDGDARGIVALAAARGVTRALHLTGQDRSLREGGPIATVIAVYESAAMSVEPERLRSLVGTTALLHSARAARRLGELVDAARIDRSTIALAAFSPAIATAAGSGWVAGEGWAAIATAARPDDDALFEAARSTHA